MAYQCRLCKSSNLSSVLHLDSVPPDVQALLNKEQLGEQQAVSFTVYQCDQCGLVQAPVQLKSDYYNDYLMSTTFSAQLREYLDGLADELIDTYSLHQGTVVDIGCGDGAFMYPFKKRDVKVVGIEPSSRSREAAENAGFEVYPGYVTMDTVIPNGPFDAFVTRQVLEHVDDISGFLSGIKKNLKPNAVGIIEVPSLEKAIKDQRFYDFFPDHINYYSLETLKMAAELNGFSVLDTRHTMFEEYNVVIVWNKPPVDMSLIKQNQLMLIDRIDNLLHSSKQAGKTTAIWGAGAKGLSIMANLDASHIDHLIDSDTNKQGKYTAVSELLIESSDILYTEKIDVLIISAVAYQQSIIDKLKTQYNYTGDVYVLAQSLLKQVVL